MPDIPAMAGLESECHHQVRVIARTSCGLFSVTHSDSILVAGTDRSHGWTERSSTRFREHKMTSRLYLR